MLKNRRYILFDLDGTLINSEPGITHCIKYALNKMGEPIQTEEQLRRFIGPPLTESFSRFCNMNSEKANKAAEFYRELYREKGVYMFEPYDGVEDMLKTLHDSGKTLILATSKPEAFAELILEKTGFAKYFTLVCGSLFDNTRTTKSQVLQFALESGKIKDKDTAVMIGDREYDVFGAGEVGLQCIGVLYGFGSSDELKSAGAAELATTPADVVDILI